MKITVNWEQLARQLGAIQENTELGPYSERGGIEIARQALTTVLGDEFWRNAVDSYVAGERGSEVIRSVMGLVHPKPAMQRCYEIYKSEADQETKANALALLVDAADYSVLPWVADFLNDADEELALVGTWILDQLEFGRSEDPTSEFELLVTSAETHTSQRVREQVAELRLRARLQARGL